MIHHEFPHDIEFQKLLTRQTKINLVTLASEFARDAVPDLDIPKIHHWIRSSAREIRPAILRIHDQRQALEQVGREMLARFNFIGSEDLLDEPQGSFLHEVIARRQGIPISMTLVYMSICRHVGIKLHGVSAPAHFLAQCNLDSGPVFLDAFHGGRLMSRPECLKWLQDLTGMRSAEINSTLKPASPRTIAIRILNNLKRVYVQKDQWKACWPVQCRLSLLQPGEYGEQRDLGIVASRSGHPGLATEILTSCLYTAPEDEIPVIKQELREAKSRLSILN
jgi:regulator of sirC expression with transglutaminase-like and TPR domain